ncbi:hypothetical protein B7P43_G08473 [Cryptotermes secundus]|uniref:MADF domain-containing protein n=1 Tax=Cryptotermes secundus TaxID=105785 RepID=A0A2J7R5Z7_9NEOP|nr:uncharacterized protein LOC111863185 [Cryptotermes secundus]PNF36258.1 hypothetical protein B7P43_G08473 [Cryptotermes secundus]
MARKADKVDNFVFVQLIEQEPGIYDKCHPNYGRRDKVDLAWERISHEMKESVAACKDRWKHIRTVFVRHLHDKTPGSSAKKRPYYLHDAMQFMIPHITKSSHQESNLAASHSKEDTALSGENEEDTQMNETSDENLPESITPSQSPAVVQQAYHQSNRDDSKQPLLSKRRRPTGLDPADTCFMDYVKQETQWRTADPDSGFLHSLLPDMKSMTSKQKRTFKIGVLNLMDEILEDTGSDQQSITD